MMSAMTDDYPNTKEVGRGPCPSCTSSDAFISYDDGHGHCFSCGYHKHKDKDEGMTVHPLPNRPMNISFDGERFRGNVVAIADRSIARDTAQKYGVKCTLSENGTIERHAYPYHDANGNVIAYKSRLCKTKDMFIEGNIQQARMFGQQLFAPGGKYITICEGELDAMSAFELTGSKWPCVSIKTGAQGAVKDVKANFEYLNSFETVVLCFDSDKAGKEAAAAVAEVFEPNRCKVVNLVLKDANEYLMQNKREEFTRLWWNAQPYTPAGIVNLADMGDSLYNEEHTLTCMYPFEGLNNLLYGIRTGELITLTAGTGTGKSSVIREMMHHVLKNTQDNIGVISLEENTRSTVFHLMSVEASQRLYIREVREQFPQDQLREWEKATVGTRRFFAFDHFGSLGTTEILNRVRYMVKILDCKWVFLDHLSILVSGLEGEDERRNIDQLMTKLRSLVEETRCALVLVSHLRRAAGSDRGHEDGRAVSLSHLRGSQAIAQLSDAVIALERDQQAEDPNAANTTTIRVLKNRYAGETGIACHLFFNRDTGRLHEVENLGDSPDGQMAIETETI
jgi:twinkle protein